MCHGFHGWHWCNRPSVIYIDIAHNIAVAKFELLAVIRRISTECMPTTQKLNDQWIGQQLHTKELAMMRIIVISLWPPRTQKPSQHMNVHARTLSQSAAQCKKSVNLYACICMYVIIGRMCLCSQAEQHEWTSKWMKEILAAEKEWNERKKTAKHRILFKDKWSEIGLVIHLDQIGWDREMYTFQKWTFVFMKNEKYFHRRQKRITTQYLVRFDWVRGK